MSAKSCSRAAFRVRPPHHLTSASHQAVRRSGLTPDKITPMPGVHKSVNGRARRCRALTPLLSRPIVMQPNVPSTDQLRDEIRDVCDDYPACTIELCRQLLGKDPGDALALLRLGVALGMLANYEDSEHALRRACDLCDESRLYIVYLQLGHMQKSRGDNAAAADWFRKVIQLRPHWAGGYIYLGGALACQGNLVAAEVEHRAATECTDGNIEEAFLNLGLVLRGQRRLQEASECFRRALDIDPDYQEAKDGLDDVEGALSYRDRLAL